MTLQPAALNGGIRSRPLPSGKPMSSSSTSNGGLVAAAAAFGCQRQGAARPPLDDGTHSSAQNRIVLDQPHSQCRRCAHRGQNGACARRCKAARRIRRRDLQLEPAQNGVRAA